MADKRAVFVPDRVLLIEGHAVSAGRAAAAGTRIDVIFVRKDGWALGASHDLAQTAYQLWREDWTERWFRYSDNSGEWWERRRLPDSALVIDELTIQRLHDDCAAAIRKLDQYAPLLIERDRLAAIRDLCADIIDGSHMGGAATEIILQRSDDDREEGRS
jgi:hypothetical protein